MYHSLQERLIHPKFLTDVLQSYLSFKKASQTRMKCKCTADESAVLKLHLQLLMRALWFMICVLVSLCWHAEIGLGREEGRWGNISPALQISSAFSFAARSVLLRTTSCWKGSPEARPLCSEYQKNNHSSQGGRPAGKTWFMIGCLNHLMLCALRTLRSCQISIWGKHWSVTSF